MYLVSRTETFAKLFFIVSFTGLFIYLALAVYTFHTAYSTVSQISGDQNLDHGLPAAPVIPQLTRDLKYILIWIVKNKSDLQEGQAPFIDHDCPTLNCYITTNRTILYGNYTNFDAIIFNYRNMKKWLRPLLPKYRSPHQKYIFFSNMPAKSNPICNGIVDNYFNWTWTYKLGSDIFSPFIEVKDLDGNVVAPRPDVIWDKHAPVSTAVDNIDEVNMKTKAVVWIMKNCEAKMISPLSVMKLQKALEEHSLVLDIYGCGNLACPKAGCLAIVERDYYFYLAYEHSISPDYVTEMVLDAYHHDAVPIVVGGADYTKFLPDKSYINFQDFTEDTLAAFIAYILKTPHKYQEFYHWKKHYTVDKVDPRRGFCELCALLNVNKKFGSHSTYENFRNWWDHTYFRDKCLQKDAETDIKVEFHMANTAFKNKIK